MATADLLAVVLTSFFFAAINAVGFSRIADSLVSLYDALLGGASYRAYRAKYTELASLRATIATISAQDEFARWARLQRKIDAAQSEYDKVSGERGRQQLASRMKCALAVRALYYGGMMLAGKTLWQGSGIRVPVLWRLAGERPVGMWGKYLIGADGTIAISLLFVIFMQSFAQLISLAF